MSEPWKDGSQARTRRCCKLFLYAFAPFRSERHEWKQLRMQNWEHCVGELPFVTTKMTRKLKHSIHHEKSPSSITCIQADSASAQKIFFMNINIKRKWKTHLPAFLRSLFAFVSSIAFDAHCDCNVNWSGSLFVNVQLPSVALSCFSLAVILMIFLSLDITYFSSSFAASKRRKKLLLSERTCFHFSFHCDNIADTRRNSHCSLTIPERCS